jgi:hypothetical protein
MILAAFLNDETRLCPVRAGDRSVLLLFKKGATAGTDANGAIHIAFGIARCDLPVWERWLKQQGVSIELGSRSASSCQPLTLIGCAYEVLARLGASSGTSAPIPVSARFGRPCCWPWRRHRIASEVSGNWTYSGLGVKTHDSAQHCYVDGRLQRSKKPQQVRGLNQNHNHEMKEIFKSTATSASRCGGPFGDFYAGLTDLPNAPQRERAYSPRQMVILLRLTKAYTASRRGVSPLWGHGVARPEMFGLRPTRDNADTGRSKSSTPQILFLYRSWAIPCPGRDVYYRRHRTQWLAKIREADFGKHTVRALP